MTRERYLNTNSFAPIFNSSLQTKKYADVIIPRGIDNQVAIKLIVQHIRTKLDERDPTKQLTTGKQTRYFDDDEDDDDDKYNRSDDNIFYQE